MHARHRAAGAGMVTCAGWEMPSIYTSIADEHLAVRTRAGLFDASHLGEIELAGPDALETVQWLTCNDASRLSVGQAQYSALTTPTGTFVDDVVVYRMGGDHFLLVVNAGSIMKDHAWIAGQARDRGADLAIVNASSRYALVALQGPAAQSILQPLTGVDLSTLKYYWWAHGEVAGARATISRTGYAGEDGFEVFVPPAQAERVWDAVLQAGQPADVRPCGLGARETLRLEAGLRQFGCDLDDTVSVVEAGLGRFVGWTKADFMGAEALRRQQADGVPRRLVAFEMREPAIARRGHAVIHEGAVVGRVTSGTRTPFLKTAIGLALVPADLSAAGTTIAIDVRGRAAAATIATEPFYTRPGRAGRESS